MNIGKLDFEGIRYGAATYKAHSGIVAAVAAAKGWNADGRTAVVGKAVTITAGAEAGYGSAGDKLLGKINQYEFDEYMTVQDAGYTVFEGVSGSLPNPGDFVVVNGSGAVIPSTGAVGPAKAIAVDATTFEVMVLIG